MKIIKKLAWSLKDGVTQSLIAEFLSCKEKANLSYKKGLSSTQTSNALTFGTLCHSVLEKQYQKISDVDSYHEKVIGDVCFTYKRLISSERLWTPDDEQNLQMNCGYLETLIPAYWKIYLEKDKQREYLAVEKEFKNQWSGDINLRGKVDVVYRIAPNEVWIMDHKTKGSLNDETETRLSFDLQGMFYILNWWLMTNHLPKGFVQNIIQRPRLRKGENETLKHFIDRVRNDVDASYFKRIQMTITKEEFDHWLNKEFRPIMDELCGWAAGLLPNYRNPVSCETRYGSCKFIRLCGLGDKMGLFQRKIVFPELAL